jgi:hypothetical protein
MARDDVLGESITRRGETAPKPGEGRQHLGRRGKSRRPAGRYSAREYTGVNPLDPIDASDPNVPAKGNKEQNE